MDNFVVYDYLSKTVRKSEQAMTVNTYSAFGWEPADVSAAAFGSVTITFKRDRKIEHKNELNRLQRKAEGYKQALVQIGHRQKSGAKIFGWIFGCVSALIFGAGMCLTMVWGEINLKLMLAGIAVGAAGIVLCAINYFICKKIGAKAASRLAPKSEEAEEKLATVCEHANSLLSNSII